MNAKELGYLVGGALIGFGVAYLSLEDRFGEKYAEMANANKRAYERASGMLTSETLSHAAEIDFNEVAMSLYHSESSSSLIEDTNRPLQDPVPMETVEEVEESAKVSINPYHKAVEATATPTEVFVNGDINDYGVSYIEEEEFDDEDGRYKYHVDLIMDDTNPLFLIDGVQVIDWTEKLGDSILLDMFQKCPPGIPPILYVRNHRTNEDYEVVRVEP